MSRYDLIKRMSADREAEKLEREAKKENPLLTLFDGDIAKGRFLDDEPYVYVGITKKNGNNYETIKFDADSYDEAVAYARDNGLGRPFAVAVYPFLLQAMGSANGENVASDARERWYQKKNVGLKKGQEPMSHDKFIETRLGKVHLVEFKGKMAETVMEKNGRKNLVQHSWLYTRTGVETDTKYDLEHDEKQALTKEQKALKLPDIESIVFAADRKAPKQSAQDKIAKENSEYVNSQDAEKVDEATTW